MDEEEVTDVELEDIIIKGKKYFIDRKTNVVYTYVEDLSKEQPEEVGELVDGELQEYEDEEEEIGVERITIEGKEYLIDPKTNIVYTNNLDDPEEVGELVDLEVAWNNEKGFIGDYGGWTWIISVPPNALSESVIEEDEKGKPIEYEYSFPIIWSGLIRQKKKPYKIIDVKDYITEFPENNIVGNLIIFTKQLLVSIKETTDKIASKVKKGDTLQKGHSHLFKYNFKPETIIQDLIDNDTITGKKRTPQEIEEKRRREAYEIEEKRRIEANQKEFELYKLKQEERIKELKELQKSIADLEKEITNDPESKILKRALEGLLKRLIPLGDVIEDEERRAKIKADEEQRLKTLKEEKRLANKKIRDEKKQREEEQKKKREEEEARRLNEEQMEIIEPAEVFGRKIDSFNRSGIDWRSDAEVQHRKLQEIVETWNEYKEIIKSIPSYPREKYEERKTIFIPKYEEEKLKVINVLRGIPEYKDLLKKYKKEDIEKSKAKDTKDQDERKIYNKYRTLKVKLGYDYFDPQKKKSGYDEKKGEKDEWGNPIGKYAKEKYFYPERNSAGYVINEAKFRQEQQERIDAYNASSKGQKERREIEAYLEELRQVQEEVNAMEAEYPFLIAKKGVGLINNPKLYEKAKQIADEKYKKPSAYKSGFIVKKYKELGGTYSGTKNDNEGIGRWFKEDWKDIVPLFKKGEKKNFGSTFSKGREEYPVYRPTKRITKDTPLTPQQIKPSNLKKQIALKQEIKGDANLPPFQGKGLNLDDYSNPKVVYQKARKYLGKDVIIQPSTNKDKKYMVYDPNTENWVHFGTMKPPMEDFTKHQDEKRRQRYLARATKIKGDWKDNKYSANNLSINILW